MKAFKKKWNSQQGASIMLALLLMLVCMMAGASILMAAASNAGKIKSNKEEQQNYLTLSSALNLLVDELGSVEYVGNYTYELYSPDGSLITDFVSVSGGDASVSGGDLSDPGYKHVYTQTDGTLIDGTLSSESWLGVVLPLDKEMDYIFSTKFEVPDNDLYRNHDYEYLVSVVEHPGIYDLELAADVDQEDYGDLADTVDINVTINPTTGVITLKAYLKEYPDYIMEAVLKLDDGGNLSDLLALKPLPTVSDTNVTVKWKLDRISKIKLTTPEPSPEPTPETGP